MSNLLKKDKGFTLIEIVLVMAIAGLILLIVFLAVQGAQKGRRDQQRKSDAARMLAAVEACAGNNQGSYTNCTGSVANIATSVTYFSPNIPPGGGVYTGALGAAPSPDNALTTFYVNTGASAVCPGDATVHPVTVQIATEQSPTTAFCVGN